jgi:hypothetical protein
MAITIDEALQDEYLTVVSRNDSAGLYRVKIGSLRTDVTIRLKQQRGTRRTEFEVSHAIKTPDQAGPYRTSLPFGEDAASALHRAVTGLTSYYGQAIKAGRQPEETWLQPW